MAAVSGWVACTKVVDPIVRVLAAKGSSGAMSICRQAVNAPWSIQWRLMRRVSGSSAVQAVFKWRAPATATGVTW